MSSLDTTRRRFLASGAAAAGLTLIRIAGPSRAWAFDGEVIPWIDQPDPNPVPNIVGNILTWEDLDSWLTPADDFFFVSHYGTPAGLDESSWQVEVDGLVSRPQSFSVADLKRRPRQTAEFTLECSGNNGLPFFIGGVGNARWTGTRLAPVLKQCGLLDEASEIIFWGADSGQVTIRDNGGVLEGGNTGMVESDGAGGLDLTITEAFARSMSVEDAMAQDNLLCYEMNNEPLPPEHGFPVRLIAPGWYGVANVKWLTRIQVTDHRYAGRFMARDYVSIREGEHNGQTIWTFATVGPTRLKSAPAKVTRQYNRYSILGVAWGAPIASVEVQIDDGPWLPATLDGGGDDSGWLDNVPNDNRGGRRQSGHSWRFWKLDWLNVVSGEHTIRSRATDTDGNVQPAQDDAFLASKVTYWESNGQIARRVLIE